tara:strand:- start:136 stop:561 length:426 start_codon:yes stop_codon:yes gene_type:complete
MAFNSLKYDTCAYNNQLNTDVSLYKYYMDNNKYVNCNKCRMVKGIVGGNDVSIIKGDMVALESDLRNATRKSSLCPQTKYTPNSDSQINIQPTINQSGLTVNTQLLHLPECQMISYNPVVVPDYEITQQCPKSVYKPIKFV